MKALFTLRIRNLGFAIILLALAIPAQEGRAQSTHQIAVSNNAFTPANITINVGDKIVWTNTSGFHNINATQITFPSNPESFGNSVGSDWTFEYTFNTTGSYAYQCDPHISFGMTGSIEVLDFATGVNFSSELSSDKIALYPNPTDSYLYISVKDQNIDLNSIKVYNVAGSLVMSESLYGISNEKINLNSLAAGFYFIELQDGLNLFNKIKILKN